MADNLPQGDKPLSVADGAPETVEIAGAKARIPSTMDIRIASVVDDKCEVSEEDYTAIILYCCLHTNKKTIMQLWQKANKDPKALYEDILFWQAKMPAKTLMNGMEEISGYLTQLSDEQALDGDDEEADDGKKKTSQPSTSSSQ